MKLAALLATPCLATGLPRHPADSRVRYPAHAMQAAQPTFRSEAELVEVAVLARDRDGRLVTDLTAADFSGLRRRDAADNRGVPTRLGACSRRGRERGPGRRRAARRRSNERTVDSRIFILVLDALHVAGTRNRVVPSNTAMEPTAQTADA